MGGEHHFVATPDALNEKAFLACNILSGKGFTSPKGGDTGPTAMYIPIYPYLLVAEIVPICGGERPDSLANTSVL